VPKDLWQSGCTVTLKQDIDGKREPPEIGRALHDVIDVMAGRASAETRARIATALATPGSQEMQVMRTLSELDGEFWGETA